MINILAPDDNGVKEFNSLAQVLIENRLVQNLDRHGSAKRLGISEACGTSKVIDDFHV